jgi:MoaA/NifB/PqqE/SkfB family radical SAM enzyme
VEIKTFNDVKWIQIETSSKCNASCPMCARNNNGIGIVDWLVEEDISTDRVQTVVDQLPNLEMIQFCGTLGEPVIAHNFLELIAIAKQKGTRIWINTNGSLRTAQWWANLACELAEVKHDVWFGIDGLEGVHEIYRQGTNYQKIIDNATAFIQAGGYATWQFIPYAHNEHQVRDCFKLSQKLGFKKFHLVKSFRRDQQARHYKTGEPFNLKPPKKIYNIIKMPKENTHVDPSNCMQIEQSSIYMSADGRLSQCCYYALAEKFDTVEELFYNSNKADLASKRCIVNCGS